MNNLLIFFALPIATIIISIALQKLLRFPPLVAAVIFAVFLIVTFVVNDLNFLVATIVYTLISLITTSIVYLICFVLKRLHRNNNCVLGQNIIENNNNIHESSNGVLSINGEFQNNGNTENVNARINIIPNTNNNGRTGSVCGNYNRR